MFDSVWIRKRKKLPGVIERLLVLSERVENRFCFCQMGARAQRVPSGTGSAVPSDRP